VSVGAGGNVLENSALVGDADFEDFGESGDFGLSELFGLSGLLGLSGLFVPLTSWRRTSVGTILIGEGL
jgi:hypothetical protein